MKLCVSKISDGVAIFKLFENVCALFELFPLVIHLSFIIICVSEYFNLF